MVRTKSNVQVSSAPVAALFPDLMMLSKNNTACSLQRELVCSDDVLKLLAGQEKGKEATYPDFAIMNGDKKRDVPEDPESEYGETSVPTASYDEGS
ncbi:hypothetical protein BGZ88_006832 [Linnemannia elongata]|nr:hypothetical protein BGZ88_006832 [Linnemannia elongata]